MYRIATLSPNRSPLYDYQTLIEVTQIGKQCHSRCAIYHQVGDCVMPREGIFARVIKGGFIRPGDRIIHLDQKKIPEANQEMIRYDETG